MNLIDKLIERGKSILPSKAKPAPQQKPGKDLESLIDDLIEKGKTMTVDDWEMEIVDRLRHDIERCTWVGIYWVRDDKLHLGAWSGPAATEHTTIPIGEGICGLAARTKKSVLVGDVENHPDYLACFPSTRSEVVVPIMQGLDAIGEIDIDGDQPNAFTEKDVLELERLASALGVRFELA